MVSLITPIEHAPKVNHKIVPALKRLSIHTLKDLLFHFPSRYEDYSVIKLAADVDAYEAVTIQGTLEKISIFRTPAKRMTLVEAAIRDESGSLRVVWYNQPFLLNILKPGIRLSLSGKTAIDKKGLYLQNPSHEKLQATSYKFTPSGSKASPSGLQALVHTGRLVPIYPETKGITSRWLRYLMAQHIGTCSALVDVLPPDLRKQYNLSGIQEAMYHIHFPLSMREVQEARRRFGFEDALIVHLYVSGGRARLQILRAPAIPLNIPLMKKFVSSLPFQLTDAQRRSIWEIAKDMEKPHPMNRLLEGDVGSGKTVVAAACALLCVDAGLRAVCMAPTEILARQHYQTFSSMLTPFNIAVGLITGSIKKDLTSSQIIVGTHALIQKGATFDNLGLVVIDEQHRFGVEQRAALVKRGTRRKASAFAQASADKQSAKYYEESPYHSDDPRSGLGALPHFLSMSATPIPRTLALTIYGDLDISFLDQMPRERKAVITKRIMPSERAQAYAFIREKIKEGRQAFVVCPRIELENQESRIKSQGLKTGQQKLLQAELKSVKAEYEKLSKHIFPDLRIVMLHGKMKSKEKEEVMKRFRDGEYDLLVATSVIEVGVDVPNATIMIIEGAERFGLATLHQFRGRVGRGSKQSYCFLFPTEEGMGARQMDALLESKNGFELAEKDLEIRGPGDFFSAEQWGTSSLALFALADPQTARDVRRAALSLIKQSPDLSQFPRLKARIQEAREELHGD